MTWQDEVTSTQWTEWQNIARRAPKAKKMHTSLVPEGCAASAIERLLELNDYPYRVTVTHDIFPPGLPT